MRPSSARRRELGAYYTPRDIADRLVAVALDGLAGAPTACDPACGDGAFLLAVADALATRGIDRETIARDLLWGIDIDPDAVDATRAAIACWSGVFPGDHVRVGDGLGDHGWSGRFDVVVGNPPFLNQLEAATVRTTAARWRVGPYTDTSALFLLAGLDLVREGGRVLLIQPQSVVAARDAKAVRDAIICVAGMWTCNEPIFDASVRVCAPLLVRGGAPSRVRRWTGRMVEAGAPVETSAWSAMLLGEDEPPALALRSHGRLGDIATATAGFRQQFYGLAPFIVDDLAASHLPKLVTCGVLDVGHCAWGERAVRFSGRRWEHPRVDLDAMDDGPLRRWVCDRLEPKVVLATQTRVLEAAIDHDGTWVPSTPVIAIHASRPDLARVAALLVAPPVSAWARSTFPGVALASDAIKLSARQVLDIPMPAGAEWERAITELKNGDLLMAARSMTQAYGCSDDVYEWWANRI